jgi:threonine-phosphate decarboxylase
VSESRPVHGGDVLGAVEHYGGAPDAYLDFSANINPLGPPLAVLELLQARAADRSLLMRYPDPRYRELRRAICAGAGIEPAAIALANGATALIDAAVRALSPGSCLLPVPAFSEYARALERSNCAIIPFRLEAAANFALDATGFCAALERVRPALCLLTNPHNPSGALLSYDAILHIVERAIALGADVIVDEAFIDYAAAESLTRVAATTEHLVVLRSLTKFFAMPALRVGYAVSAPAIAQAIDAVVPSWPIDTAAAEAAVAALGAPGYVHRTLVHNQEQRARLAAGLEALGIIVFPSQANFLLLATRARSAEVTQQLAVRHRVLVRDCASFDGLEDGGYIRVAVLAADQNERLVTALRDVLKALDAHAGAATRNPSHPSE